MRAPGSKYDSENQDSTVYMNHRSKTTQCPYGKGKGAPSLMGTDRYRSQRELFNIALLVHGKGLMD